MTEPRERRRPGRPIRAIGGISQRPWKQLVRPYAPIEILSADQIEAIHAAALTVLEEIGMRVLEPRAREYYKSAGAMVNESDMRVRFDRAMIAELIKKSPREFTLAARNPQRNLRIGGRHCILSSVGGPAYVMDRDKGRRASRR